MTRQLERFLEIANRQMTVLVQKTQPNDAIYILSLIRRIWGMLSHGSTCQALEGGENIGTLSQGSTETGKCNFQYAQDYLRMNYVSRVADGVPTSARRRVRVEQRVADGNLDPERPRDATYGIHEREDERMRAPSSG